MDVHVEYLSSGVNQTPLGFDWGTDDTVCLAASTGLLLYNPQLGRVTGASTKQHTKKVTCVRWIRQTPRQGPTLVSGGADGKAVLWTQAKEKIEGLSILHPSTVLDHEGLVTLVDAMVLRREEEEMVLVVTVTTDFITTWLVCPESGKHEKLHSSAPPESAYLMSLKLFVVPGAKYPVLAAGGHRGRVHLMAAGDLGVYQPVCKLSGHEDWVTSLDVLKEDDGGFLLASGSKDSTVRIWKVSPISEKKKKEEEEEVLQKSSLINTEEELKLKSINFTVPPEYGEVVSMSVSLDTVLAGHEGLVSEVCWHRSTPTRDGGQQGAYRLLTCSKTHDRSIIVWEPDPTNLSGIWVEVARLGEVGGNMEGYYGCQFNSSGSEVLGCSYQGGLHLWRQREGGVWDPCVAVGGHFSQVADISWDPRGRYLLSASKDQSTRLHAAWKTENKVVWHEVGRPQVHGYDMVCITTLGKYKFASGSEEKVVRGFTAPANFIRNFGRICGFEIEDDLAECQVGEGAAVPSLGLSNKAVTMADLQDDQQDQTQGREEVQAYFKPIALKAPPTEDQLMQNTLWPEAAKLYGHGNDLFAIAATADGSFLASSCRAANNIDAAIILWNTTTWLKVDTLTQHRLTVTQLAFSPDDQHLLSISRDRTWAIFTRTQDNKGITYRLSDSSTNKKTLHSRVIWSCAWLLDSSHFVTASRDKTVGVWGVDGSGWGRKALLSESDEVTAVAVGRLQTSDSVLLATGLVSGDIHLRIFNAAKSTFSSDVVKVTHKHHDTVRRLAFRPAVKGEGEGEDEDIYLASCSNDNRVQIYRIDMR